VLGGKRWAVSRGRVAEFSISARQSGPNAAGWRNRPRVAKRNGQIDVLVVNHVDDVLARLSAWLVPDAKT